MYHLYLNKAGEGKTTYNIRMHLATSPGTNRRPKPKIKPSTANIFYVRNFTDLSLENSTGVSVFLEEKYKELRTTNIY